MPGFVAQGGSDGTWGTEHNDSHAVYSDPTTGQLSIVSYTPVIDNVPGQPGTVFYEGNIVTIYDHTYK